MPWRLLSHRNKQYVWQGLCIADSNEHGTQFEWAHLETLSWFAAWKCRYHEPEQGLYCRTTAGKEKRESGRQSTQNSIIKQA